MPARLAALRDYRVDAEFDAADAIWGEEACIHTRMPAARSAVTQRACGGSW